MKCTVERICPACSQPHTIRVNETGLCRWYFEGVHIQNALPELSDTEREALLSGLCPSCQDLLFD